MKQVDEEQAHCQGSPDPWLRLDADEYTPATTQHPPQCRSDTVVDYNRLQRVDIPQCEALKQYKDAGGQCDAGEQINHQAKVRIRLVECVTRMQAILP